jgi:ankyrin repeat protein
MTDAKGLMVAWQAYLAHGDRDQLFIALSGQFGESAWQALLWLALSARDWELVNSLEVRGVSLPPDPVAPIGGQLFEAQELGDVPEIVEWLIERNAHIDARGINGWTPLHLACYSGHSQTARLLLQYGADVNARSSVDGGWTPLMEACAVGHKPIVELLLEFGADPKIGNLYEGGTARHIAFKYRNMDVVAVLDSWAKKPVREIKRRTNRKPGASRRRDRG